MALRQTFLQRIHVCLMSVHSVFEFVCGHTDVFTWTILTVDSVDYVAFAEVGYRILGILVEMSHCVSIVV